MTSIDGVSRATPPVSQRTSLAKLARDARQDKAPARPTKADVPKGSASPTDTNSSAWRSFSDVNPFQSWLTRPARAAAPDPKAEAEKVLNVGDQWFQDDYPARLEAYGDSLAKGDASYRKQLLAEVLKQDPQAFGSWLDPSEINNAAGSGAISQSERASMAETFAGAYNDGLMASHENVETGVAEFAFNPLGRLNFSLTAVENAEPTAELLDFIDAGGSTDETREFRQKFAQHLTDSHVLNDEAPDGSSDLSDSKSHAAALAALVISGDPRHPELAQIFMSTMGDDKRGEFLERVENGSINFSAEYLEPQVNSADPDAVAKVADIAQPDALSVLVNAVGEVQGTDADRLAVELSRASGDHDDWFTGSSERADAWTNLFNGHADVILDELTNPDGMPSAEAAAGKAKVEPAFRDRAHDLGAYMRLMNGGDDTAKIEQARALVTDYASGLKDNIAAATKAEDAIDNGPRLGFLGAAVTDSVGQAFEDYAKTQEQQRALVGFVLDLALSAVPAGSLAKSALGDWVTDNVGSSAVKESLEGFSGQLIDSTTGKLTDAAKEHILGDLDQGDLRSLVAQLQESNPFIESSLFNELPGPKYNTTETGRENTIQNVRGAYDTALVWLNA